MTKNFIFHSFAYAPKYESIVTCIYESYFYLTTVITTDDLQKSNSCATSLQLSEPIITIGELKLRLDELNQIKKTDVNLLWPQTGCKIHTSNRNRIRFLPKRSYIILYRSRKIGEINKISKPNTWIFNSFTRKTCCTYRST